MSRTTHPKEDTKTNSAIESPEVNTFLDSITAIAGPVLALTSKDRRRSLKLRKGGEKVVPTLLALSDRIGLSVPAYPTSAIQAHLDKLKALSRVHEAVVSAEKQLADAIFQSQSQLWEGAVVHYSVLKRLGQSDGDIANALAPVTEFFAHKAANVVKDEEEKRGHRKGALEPKGTKAASADGEATSARAPAVTATASAAPASVSSGAGRS